MKKLILHIGYNKTGTTAIQKSFKYNRKRLEKKGIFYPMHCRGKRKSPAHHSLAESLLFYIKKPLPDFVNKKIYSKYPYDHYWNLLKDELKKAKAQTVFISSEAFSRLRGHPDQMRFIRDQLLDYQIKILVYLRSQTDFFESAYNQAVKRGHESRTVEELMHSGWMNINYYEELEQWASVFGSENIIVRVFDKKRMPDGVVADVLEVMEKEGLLQNANEWFSKYKSFKWNIRLPNNMVEVKRKINAKYRLPVFIDRLINFYMHWKGKYGVDIDLLSIDQKEQIIENYFESNRKLGEKYLNRDSPFK